MRWVKAAGLGVLVALLGCGGTDFASIPEAGSDGLVAQGDARSDASLPDGGAVSNPGKITCGPSLQCSAPSEICCTRAGDGGLMYGCEASGACGNGFPLECDEKADCAMGLVCCYESVGNNLTASCHADCGGGGGSRTQACKTLGECQMGTCSVRQCSGGFSVQTCAPIPNLCP